MGSHDDLSRAVTPISDIDLRRLADIGDPNDVHLSVYLPTGGMGQETLNRAFVSARVESIRAALHGDIEDRFNETFSLVQELLFHDPVPGERGRVVFASAPKDFLKVYRIGVEPDQMLVLDNSPFILPLAKLRDEHEDYGIILMDSQQAKLYSVRSRVLEQVESSSIDLMNRHKKGGMSQKRFNRLRRGAIEAFVDQIVDDLEHLDAMGKMRGLVVAGPGEVKKQLLDSLPKRFRDMVIGTLDVDIDVPSHVLMTRSDEMAEDHEDRKEDAAIERLRAAVFKERLGALGVAQVRDALVQGRVDTLLVLEDLSVPGWICESCKRVHQRPGTCPDCGGSTSGADIVEELYELAERTGAEVEVVESSEFLASVGGLGAVLRY